MASDSHLSNGARTDSVDDLLAKFEPTPPGERCINMDCNDDFNTSSEHLIAEGTDVPSSKRSIKSNCNDDHLKSNASPIAKDKDELWSKPPTKLVWGDNQPEVHDEVLARFWAKPLSEQRIDVDCNDDHNTSWEESVVEERAAPP